MVTAIVILSILLIASVGLAFYHSQRAKELEKDLVDAYNYIEYLEAEEVSVEPVDGGLTVLE